MRRLIRQLADWKRLFLAPTGRHRAERLRPTRQQPKASRSTLPRSALPRPAPAVRTWYEPVDGTVAPLGRPYLTAYERGEKARLQRLRRDTLWCATYGVGLDTRDIHGLLGAA